MTERTDGRKLPGNHNLGRCLPCNLAFHWRAAQGVTCPKCGRRLDATTRRYQAGFLPLTPGDVQAIQDANGYSGIKAEFAKVGRRATAFNKVAGARWGEAQTAAEFKVTNERGAFVSWDYEAPAYKVAIAKFDALKPEREAIEKAKRALWAQVKGVPVAVSCLEGKPVATRTVTPKAPEPGSVVAESIEFRRAATARAEARAKRTALVVDAEAEPVASERQRSQERVQRLVNAGIDAILGPVTVAPAPAKGTHGGARKGAGRKPVGENVKAKSVSLPAEMIEAIRAFGGGNLSAGIRRLHDEHFGSMGELA